MKIFSPHRADPLAESARLLAVFVVDTDETTLTTPYKK
jgi:hypothetical protein